jgi:hypothetical protein
VAPSSGWTLDKPSVIASFNRWSETHPDAQTVRHFWDWVLDLLNDPLHRGKEDENQPGVFYGRVPGTNVGATFVLDLEERVVHVVMVSWNP